jgi:hypothetical protein
MTSSRLHRLLLLACAVFTGGAGAASPSLLAPEPIRFSFQVIEGGGTGSTAGDAFLDIGRVSASPGRARGKAIVVTRRIAVRLEGMAPTARVSVALLAETPGCTVRLDGVTLSSIPRLVNPVHRVGSTVVHQLEMSIPPGVPAGPLLSNLQWLAETD